MESEPAEDVSQTPAEILPQVSSSQQARLKLAEIRERETRETNTDPDRPKVETGILKQESGQSVILRYFVFAGMYGLLCSEIWSVLCILDKQGRGIYHLADWLIGSLITVVFLQTVWVLQVIATHLFPKGNEKMALRFEPLSEHGRKGKASV